MNLKKGYLYNKLKTIYGFKAPQQLKNKLTKSFHVVENTLKP